MFCNHLTFFSFDIFTNYHKKKLTIVCDSDETYSDNIVKALVFSQKLILKPFVSSGNQINVKYPALLNAFVFILSDVFRLEKQIHLRLQSAKFPKDLPLWH